MLLFLAFLAVPLIEITLFVTIGSAIGLWPTLAIVIGSAILGTWLMRSQGQVALAQVQTAFNDMQDPTEPLAHGAMVIVAGMLLLTPGFFTDTIGLLLLLPPVRLAVMAWVRRQAASGHFEMHAHASGRMYRPRRPGDGDIIDGDYKDVTQNPQKSEQPSGWVDGPK